MWCLPIPIHELSSTAFDELLMDVSPIRLNVLDAGMLTVVNTQTGMACTCLGYCHVCVCLCVNVRVKSRAIVFHTAQCCPTLVLSYTRSTMRYACPGAIVSLDERSNKQISRRRQNKTRCRAIKEDSSIRKWRFREPGGICVGRRISLCV